MGTHRFTARLDEERAAWVEEIAEQHDASAAWVLRQAVDAVRDGGVSVLSAPERTEPVLSDADRTAPDRTADLQEQLDRIEADVSAVRAAVESEASVASGEPSTQAGDTPVESEPSEAGSEADVDDLLEDWAHGRGEQERQASDEVAREALLWLREHGGEVRKADVPLDELGEDDPLGRTTDTLWTQVVRAAFQHAAGRGAVDQPTSRTYRWVGDVDE
jgi:hypothetical protein